MCVCLHNDIERACSFLFNRTRGIVFFFTYFAVIINWGSCRPRPLLSTIPHPPIGDSCYKLNS